MKVLVVSEYIAPVNAIAAIRWTKLAKYLSLQHDVQVDILTNSKDYSGSSLALYYKYDDTLAGDIAYFNQVYEIRENFRIRTINSLFKSILRTKKSRANEIKKEESGTQRASCSNKPSLYKRVYDFAFACACGIRASGYVAGAFDSKVDFKNYDVVISSFGPSWTHEIGKRIKQICPDIVWIADYRDPPTPITVFPQKRIDGYVSSCTGKADAITAVSDGNLEKICPPNIKGRAISNGFDPDELKARNRQRSDNFVIAYTGTLYDMGDMKSDLTPLLRAISELIKDGDIDAGDIEFIYSGHNSNRFESQVAGFNSIPYVDLGLVSREDALAIQDKSSILAWCTWNTEKQKGVATAKIYEYISSGVPIAAICTGKIPNSLGKEMIAGANVGICAEEASAAEDYIKLKNFVLEKYQQWKDDGITSCDTNWDYLNSFRHDVLAGKVYDLMQELLIKSRAGKP